MTVSPADVGFSPAVSAVTVTLNPNIRALTVNASCAPQNGAVLSVAPLSSTSNVTDDFGNASFNITTSVASPIAGQTPTGTCTFSVTGDTHTASVVVHGALFQPTIALDRYSITNSGSSNVVATITPAYSGVQLDGTCTSNIAVVSITPTKFTDAQGRATFSISAQNLIVSNPNLSIVPTASCKIVAHGGIYPATITFTTGNSCAFGLQPNPSVCGNPN